MAEHVIGPATEVVKCFAEPIKRQFNYLCCFNTNIQDLRDEAKRLDDAKEGLQWQVDAAKRNTEDIVPEVETWLGKANEIQQNYSSGIEPAILNVKNGCLAIKSRFSLSKKATKMVAAMKELHDDGKFGRISIPAPPAAMSSIPVGHVYELKSRKDFEEDIMATLREKKLSLMGIYGMGGVGKTTMAKKIMTRAREEGLFDEIVIAVVCQPIDMLRIQKEMAELLGLKLEVDGLLARAHLLRGRLMNTNKSILIVLDDLWDKLNLEDLGIPKECTVLLTSRDRDVFRAMNVDKTFQMKTLEDVEAWSLFKEKVGACIEDQSLIPIAQEIVRECNGLPIAIVTVGVALKDKMDKFNWEDALHDLRSYNPQDIPKFLAQVYNPLKLSYDLLESPHARPIFLLCCLFPEDRNIRISTLYLYAWGLGIFEGISRLQVARNKMQTLVEMLKSRSLLLDGKNERYVKMHDIVRDVGIFIAAKEGLMDPNLNWKSRAREESIIDSSWISLFDGDKITLPRGSTFPNLRFLLIEGPNSERRPRCDNLFESDRKLCVLSIGIYVRLRSLPHTIQLQKNMRTLILYNCTSLEDISVVGELVSLEILQCHSCRGMKELPVEIGRLNQLKLLDILNCHNLKTIKAGVISSLIGLEELRLMYSFNKWELAVEEGKNAAVCELNFLSRLTKLKIQIEDASLAAVQIHLPNLVEFNITLRQDPTTARSSYRRQMTLGLNSDVIIGDWIPQLLRSTESLFLEGEGSSKLLPLLPQFQSLKELFIENVKFERTTTTLFPLLEVERTEAVFGKLEVLKVKNCDNIKSLFSLSIARNLVNLRELIIENCGEMVKVIEDKDNEVERTEAVFGKLEVLKVKNCNNIKSLFSLSNARNFVNLIELIIENCGEMVKVIEDKDNEIERTEVGFGKLEVLNVRNCDNIKNLFTPSIARNLVNLRVLIIKRCGEMINVIEDKDDNEIERFPFIYLEKLELKNLPKLKSICDWGCALQLPSLIKVFISNCPLMERFSYGSLTSPNSSDSFKDLKSIKIESCLMLEQVILWNEEEGGNDINRRITFPKLDGLLLHDLPRLTSFFKGIQSIEFPLLTKMVIKNCPHMKNLVSTTENETTSSSRAINRDADADDSLHLFCKSVVGIGKLKVLKVKNCDIIKSLFSPSIAENLVNLKELIIESCCEMVKVIEEKDDNEVERSPFINLATLKLKNLPKLKDFCDWGCALQLPSLIQVLISNCPLMERFSRGSFSSDSFKDLNSIEIESCFMLEQVILWNEEEGGDRRITFPKLDGLLLRDLPRLTYLCKGIQSIEFPLLTKMEIKNCPDMKNLAENETEVAFGMLEKLIIDGYDNVSSERSLSLWCDQNSFGFFTGLEYLEVKNCGKTKSLFSPSIAGNLINLKGLSIESCPKMVKVMEGDEDKSSLFIKLKDLWLINLPKLKVFCDLRCALQLPSLEIVVISKCPEMEFFSFGSLTTPNLEKIYMESEDISNYTKDLNDALFGGDFLHLDILFGTDQ